MLKEQHGFSAVDVWPAGFWEPADGGRRSIGGLLADTPIDMSVAPNSPELLKPRRRVAHLPGLQAVELVSPADLL